MRYLPTSPRVLALLLGFAPGLSFATESSIPLLFEKPQATVRSASPTEAEVSTSTIQTHAASLTQQTEQLRLALAEDVLVQRGRSYQLASGAMVWEGEVMPSRAQGRSAGDSHANGSVILLRHDNRIYGTLNLQGKVFQIRPLADGTHRLIQYDPELLPPDLVVDNSSATAQQAQTAAADAMARSGTKDKPIFVRVMVNYTEAVLKKHPFINDYVDLLIAETNMGFAHSDVYIKLDLSAQKKVDYNESSASGQAPLSTALEHYRGKHDKEMNEIHAARDAGHADIAVLLLDRKNTDGGQAYSNVREDFAFAVVSEEGASGGYGFGHQIGHLFGAGHDSYPGSERAPYAYGHGYQSTQWRTIMALPCKSHACPAVNYWSNPAKRYGGLPMGHVNVNDNRRVLNERAATVATFRAD